MRKIREVLRLHFDARLSIRKISASTKISVGAIQKLLKKAQELEIPWPLPEELDDSTLASKFYPKADTRVSTRFHLSDWVLMHQELKRKGMTKVLLWEEYSAQYPNRCYSYSQFCDRYLHWQKKQRRSMRQIHKAGEKLFVDYAGQTVPIVNGSTGEIRHAQIFVAVMGASNYTYVEATWSQQLSDWLGSHVRAFEFLGGVPEIVVPDNLKSGVTKACRYEPELNPSYHQLANHYNVVVIPARPYKPKDKSKAELGVLIIERWILARLRHQTFFSLAELNQCISALLIGVNQKPFKQLLGNRQQSFEQLDKPVLRPLPPYAYQFVDIKPAKVNIDYHIQYKQHFYSVPHHLVGEKVMLHAGDKLLQIYFHDQLITSHVRKHIPGTSTEPAHMPKRHSKHQQWTPQRLLNWGNSIGVDVQHWVQRQLNSKHHPEQAYRACLGLLNLSRNYPEERLNKACAIANKQGLYRVKQVKSILTSNLDKLPQSNEQETISIPQDHENIRGPKDYH